jgi:FixJ family two-component response regulator
VQVPDTAVVHIIEDDASLRDAIDSLLRSVGLKTRAYGSVQSFLSDKHPDVPGCLLLDVRLPGMSGLDFQTNLAEHNVHMPAIMMTGHGDIPMTVRAMKAGAIDFLTKPFRDQDMLDAVMAAIEKDRRRREGDQGAAALRAKYETLTPREQQVLVLVTAGKMNKQVAADLNLSEITVKIHRGSVMRKMAARSLADLVRMAEALGQSVHKQPAH